MDNTNSDIEDTSSIVGDRKSKTENEKSQRTQIQVKQTKNKTKKI